MRGLAVDLGRDELCQPGGLGTGAMPVEGRIGTAVRVDVVADVSLVRLDHAPTQSGTHRQPAEAAEELVCKRVLMTAVRALERLQDAALILTVGREEHRPSR